MRLRDPAVELVAWDTRAPLDGGEGSVTAGTSEQVLRHEAPKERR